jgi:hypothetical protein
MPLADPAGSDLKNIIENAAAASVIEVESGTFTLSGAGAHDHEIFINHALTVRAKTPGSVVIVGKINLGGNGAILLDGLVITGSPLFSNYGGAIFISGGFVDLVNLQIYNSDHAVHVRFGHPSECTQRIRSCIPLT